MWKDRSVTVIIPTYRESATIRGVVEGFDRLGIVDEILVVNNNAEPGTSEEVSATRAREVHEPVQGYGAAIRRGIAESSADLICICEADGTFDPADLSKLLEYADEFDFVYGTRTLRDMIWGGANMGRFLRWGNWGVAKLMEMAFGTSHLSDVGCTMRVVSGPAARALIPRYTVTGGEFGPEMMLLSVIGGWRIIQLPVNYRARRGGQGTTESFWKSVAIGLRMLWLLGSYRLRRRRIVARLRHSGLVSARATQPRPRGPGGEPKHMFPGIKFPQRRKASVPAGLGTRHESDH
jgi:glycosyltransferase involved in cell wall biosynthesis